MIPVELRLNNFLSYGTEAPALDFEQFHVACLSGGNGQGKSALLDAMTWALWGEARKSSGNRKPDDDLIRIGTRHMKVEFVFDIEGERYRVTRSYARSATGKTTTSDLEFHLREPGADGFRPLTGANQRATQALIEKTLGLDYDTFINSAMLLQGRSDEFTKKRPSERKAILTRILNLSRYKELARLARERWREAREEMRHVEAEIERLETALEAAPAWQEEKTAVEAEVAEEAEHLAALRADEKALTERLAGLDAQAREADGLSEAIARHGRRIEEHATEEEDLLRRIQKAETLLAEREKIERAHARCEALQREREALDAKRDRHLHLEKEIERCRAKLKDCRAELEKKLYNLEADQKRDRDLLEECEAQLKKEEAVRTALKEARQAQKRLEELEDVRLRREELTEKRVAAERALERRREQLCGELRALEAQLSELQKEMAAMDGLKKRAGALKTSEETLQALQAQRENVREKGQALAEVLDKRAGQLAARRDACERQEALFERFQETSDGQCPMCRAALTPAHRREVEDTYRTTIRDLQEALRKGREGMAEKEARRDELRAAYRALGKRIDELAGVPAERAAVETQLKALEKKQEALKERTREAARLRRKIEREQYGQESRAQMAQCQEALARLAFDKKAYERVRSRAAQVKSCEERLAEFEAQARRKEMLEKRLRAHAREAEALRQQLSDGAALEKIKEQIMALEKECCEVGFDAEHFDAVRAELKELSEAGARMQALLHAQQNKADWKGRLERVQKRLAGAQDEKRVAEEKREAIQEALKAREGLEKERQDTSRTRQGVEEGISALQQRLGELKARLEQAGRDCAALKESRQAHAEARSRRALYKHLRMAFGKHGIPSLIIEQTLPEIEERANALLDRLTDGRMHVRLETLKDKKSGGTKETLEIIITDEQGVPRPYETFSGGEAFRVNFALRIALAQLLAERNGVRIRTLIIDEGFGTQDADGVQNLVEAIRVIQDDFDKIIVITHLEGLKAVFPVRIEVEKDAVDGSSFELIGV